MTTTIALLLVLSLVLASLEVIMPGGILGILSAVALIAASVLGYGQFGYSGALGIFAISSILILAVVFWELKFLSKTKYGQRIFLSSRSVGRILTENKHVKLEGKEGTTITMMGPTGLVDIEGTHHEAYSQDGQLAKGVRVEVIAVDNFRIIVKKKA